MASEPLGTTFGVMGLWDSLRRWLGGDAAGEDSGSAQEHLVVLPADIDDAEDYEDIIRRIAAEGGLELDEICCERSGRALAVRLGLGDQLKVFTQGGLFVDLEQLLPALDALHPSKRERFLELDRDNFGEEFGVAFGGASLVERLRADGFKVMTRDAPRALDAVTEVEGLELQGTVERWEDGTLKQVTPAKDQKIDGVSCQAGHVVQWGPRGQLEVATLAEPLALPHLSLPAGTEITFWEESTDPCVAVLATSVELGGMSLPPGTSIELTEEGGVAFVRLGASTMANGRELPADSLVSWQDGSWDWSDVDLPPPPAPDDDSPYETQVLDEETTIAGLPCAAGSKVVSYRGHPQTLTLARDVELDSIPCQGGEPVHLYEDGSLDIGRLSRDVEIQGLPAKGGTTISFWTDRQLSTLTLAEDHEVDGLALPAGSRVGFYEEIRKLADLAVPVACTIAGVECITGQALRFDDAGAVIEVGHVSDEYFRHDYVLVDGDEPYIDR